MEVIPGLFVQQQFLIFPTALWGWLGGLMMLLAVVWAGWNWYENPVAVVKKRWWLGLLLVIATPVTSTVMGIRFPVDVRPLPGGMIDSGAPALMFFAALPWVFAAGLLGPIPAAVLGGLSGWIIGIFDTHSPFSMLEMAGLALVFSASIRQRYRTAFYGFLRHPAGAGFLIGIAFAPVYMLSALFVVNSSLAVRLDYALTQTWPVIVSRGLELFAAALIAEVFYLLKPFLWGRKGELLPSPAEVSLQTRFFYGTVPLVLVLFVALTVGDWLVAGYVARQMVDERMSSTAKVAADGIPFFLDTGQSLIKSMAAPELLEASPVQVTNLLKDRLRSVPYFSQLGLLDKTGEALVGAYPETDMTRLSLTEEEKAGVKLALQGVAVQTYTVPPRAGENGAQVSFVASVSNGREIQGVLVGRTDLSTNPFTIPSIHALEAMKNLRDNAAGEGFILDENRRVLYPTTGQSLDIYPRILPANIGAFEETSSTGTRRYSYYQPAQGRPWIVVLSVSAETTQEMALNIAIPLLITLFIISIAAFALLRAGLRSVTSTVRLLSAQAAHISVGDLDRLVQVHGADEVARLAEAFEQMRLSLKARLDELNRLLVVSQGVAANLEIHGAVKPILTAGLLESASSSRVALIQDVTLEPEQDMPVAFGTGPSADLFAYLDSQLFELMRHQDLLTIPNVGRMRRLNIPSGRPQPGALLGVAIRHENLYYGTFWVGFDQPHNFTEEEIRFLSTLCGEIALAAASARLYATAEVGRQRLEAVLNATPDPVLVIDEQSKLLLLNPAALQTPGLVFSTTPGLPIQEVVQLPELLTLLGEPLNGRLSSRDITLPNNKVYYCSVAPVTAADRPVGRICLLRDITHFKELDQMKSDFVATVSHDLRSPLTLMRGYATMMQMVGELNEQQKGYTKKILGGVENMTRLVNNLLDLGRIETGIGLQIEHVQISLVVEEVMTALQLQASQKEIQLVQENGTELAGVMVDVDRALIQQALTNLVENAIKYTSQGGLVRVRFEQKPTTLIFQVMDNGIGIAPLDLPRLFEKFYRSGRREAYQQRGSGLGLAIVKSIVERHNGRVLVDSQLGKGSVFTLELPLRQVEPVAK